MNRSERVDAVDIVKGIAIVLVVYGHVAQGAYHRQWIAEAGYRFVDSFIYSFHMPAFFVVAGLFVEHSLQRGAARFAFQKFATILYPYILWAAIALASGPFLARFKSGGTAPDLWPGLMSLLSGEQSWFLPTLFLTLMIAAATSTLPAPLRVIAGVAASRFVPDTGILVLDRAIDEFAFVAIGQWIGVTAHRIRDVPRWGSCAVAAAGFALLAGAIASLGWPDRNLFVPLGLLGTGALFFAARTIDGTAIGRATALVGRASLAIFLVHPYFQGATREIVCHLAGSTPWLQLLIPTIVAVAAPALLWALRRPLRIGWLFALPLGGGEGAGQMRLANGRLTARAALLPDRAT